MGYAPDPAKNLTLGKGILYFNKKNPITGLYEGYRDLGNAPEISANITPDKLPHYSSRGGLKVKDNEVIKELALKFSWSLDEPNSDNLAMTFMADNEEVTQSASTDQTLLIPDVMKGRYFLTGKKKITNVIVNLTDTPATIYVAGTDYVVDSTYGRIFIPFTSSITAGTDLTVTYDVAAGTYTRLKALNQTRVEGMLHFISDNGAGENHDMQIWRTSLIPTGNIGLISDDWLSLSYEAEVFKDEVYHPDAPYMIIDSMMI